MDSDNFLVVSSNSIENKNIEEYIGIVVGSTVRARNVGSDFFATLKNLVGGEVVSYSRLLERARDQAYERMIREAKEKGWPVGGEPKDWANESISLRNYPYDFIVEKMEKPGDAPEKLKPISEIRELIKTRSYKPKDKDLPRLSYPYQERNYKLVKQRLFQAGVRLAETINRIYYKPMTKKGPRK